MASVQTDICHVYKSALSVEIKDHGLIQRLKVGTNPYSSWHVTNHVHNAMPCKAAAAKIGTAQVARHYCRCVVLHISQTYNGGIGAAQNRKSG